MSPGDVEAADPLTRLVTRERSAPGGRERVPEPMVMDDEDSVAAFDGQDPVLQVPVYRYNAEAMSRLLPEGGSLLDLGCGSGRLLAHLSQARPDVSIVGVDLAERMLATGREALQEAGLADRVELHQADMTDVPASLFEGVDLVSTVWALHHLPTAEDVRRCLAQIAQARETTGCAVWIFDFARLRHEATLPTLMQMAPGAPARLRDDGIASERAAWSPSELRAALTAAGLHDLQGGAEAVIGHYQAYYAPSEDGRRSGHDEHWSAPPLPEPSRQVYERVRAAMPTP